MCLVDKIFVNIVYSNNIHQGHAQNNKKHAVKEKILTKLEEMLNTAKS